MGLLMFQVKYKVAVIEPHFLSNLLSCLERLGYKQHTKYDQSAQGQ
jgi:hypothetical protein